jgi:hypothetical protein
VVGARRGIVVTKAPAARHELPGLGEAVCSVHAWHTVTARNSKEDPEAKAKRSTACHDDLMAD